MPAEESTPKSPNRARSAVRIAAQVVDGDAPQLDVLSFHVAEPLQFSLDEQAASGAVTSSSAATAIGLQSFFHRTVAS